MQMYKLMYVYTVRSVKNGNYSNINTQFQLHKRIQKIFLLVETTFGISCAINLRTPGNQSFELLMLNSL